MKIFLILISFLIILPLSAIEESKELENEEVIKVKITDDSTELPQVDIVPETKVSEVEIEVVEKLDKSSPSNSLIEIVKPAKVVAEIKPTDPDKNLIIYFILLMVVVVGIMVLASVIPGPRAKDQN